MPIAVDVALATYNGAAYLPAFLASVDAQTHGDLTIVASDDGSTDETVAILSGHMGRPAVLHRNAGPRGFSANFANALDHTTAPYVALADQDDWWHPDKIARLIRCAQDVEAQHGGETPVLIFSDIVVVNERLETLRNSLFAGGAPSAATLTFKDYFFGNHVPGCAMLLNRALIEKALPIPPEVTFHDWWFMLVASGIGRVMVVNEPLIKYRQHGGNTLGAPVAAARQTLFGFLGKLRARAMTVKQVGGMMTATLQAYNRRFARELEPVDRDQLAVLLHGSPLQRLKRFSGVRASSGRAVTMATCLLIGSRILPLPE